MCIDKNRRKKNGKKQEGRDVKTLHKTPQGPLSDIIARCDPAVENLSAWAFGKAFWGLTEPSFCDKLFATRGFVTGQL